MPVATTQLVMLLFVFIVDCSALQLIQVVFKSDWAVVTNHRMPFQNDASILSALIIGDRTVVMGVVNVEAPTTVLPQGAIPFSMVRFFVTAFETVGEGGALALMTLVLGDSM